MHIKDAQGDGFQRDQTSSGPAAKVSISALSLSFEWGEIIRQVPIIAKRWPQDGAEEDAKMRKVECFPFAVHMSGEGIFLQLDLVQVPSVPGFPREYFSMHFTGGNGEHSVFELELHKGAGAEAG